MIRGLKILIVDDDQINLLLLEELLRDKFKFKTTSTGKQALGELQKESFDLVITDLHMPEMDGMELLNHIKNQFDNLPVIMMSASYSSNYEPGVTRSDLDAFLLNMIKEITELSSKTENQSITENTQ